MKHKILQFIMRLFLVFAFFPMPVFAEGDIVSVPAEGMVIVNGTYYGISKSWYEQINAEGKVMNFALVIPSGVTSIANDALRDNFTYDKQNYGAITEYNDDKSYTDKYEIVSVDFSSATDLTFIGRQAAMYCKNLVGVLDLSATKVETIDVNAFRGSGISGVILPASLKNLGGTDGGSAFRECENMAFVRTAGMNPDAVFQLPEGLLAIGKHSFYGCTGLPAGTVATIPASVTYVGSEAFYYSDNITTIRVLTDNASGYDGAAFKAGSYGLGKRLTVFENSAAKNTFSPSGLTTYKNSITYEFTLIYKNGTDEIRQPKLYAQRLNVCKNESGAWFVDDKYTMPDPGSLPAETGYDTGWELNGELLKNTTILKPAGDELVVNVKKVLSRPEIEVIVDGVSQGKYTVYPQLNLTNDRPHTIGVNVTHPISNVADADVKVKFEYHWIDIWQYGTEGPRMSEDGFGRYSVWDKPKVKNTITINGAQHERTSTGNYSGTDYGDGYYLLIIYGYYIPKSGGQYKLFYQSANTVIGSDPYRTTDTAYIFDVVTSDPAIVPVVQVQNVTVEPGYESASLEAVTEEKDGHSYTYQWYEADKEGQTQGGRKIEGATGKVYNVPAGKDAGDYYYYVEVTSVSDENGDVATACASAKFTVKAPHVDPPSPTRPPSADVPKTADRRNVDMWISLFAVSLSGIAVISAYFYKKNMH